MPAERRTVPTHDPSYVPAAGRAALTRLYDAAMGLTMREDSWRTALTSAVVRGLHAGGVIVDVGCGTATQAIALARARPDARVIGVDPDPEVLAIAAIKPGADRVQLRSGTAADVQLAAASADRIVLSLVLHHLDPTAKVLALAEALRVLRPDGELHVLDWGPPAGPLPRLGFSALQLLDGRENTHGHATGDWLAAFTDAGLRPPHRLRRLSTVWGTLEQLVVPA